MIYSYCLILLVRAKKPLKKEIGIKKKAIDTSRLRNIKTQKKIPVKVPKSWVSSQVNDDLSRRGFRYGLPFSEALNVHNDFETLIPTTKSPQNKALRELQNKVDSLLSKMDKLQTQNNVMYRDIIRISSTISKLYAKGLIDEEVFQKLEKLVDEEKYFQDDFTERPIDDDTPEWANSD